MVLVVFDTIVEIRGISDKFLGQDLALYREMIKMPLQRPSNTLLV